METVRGLDGLGMVSNHCVEAMEQAQARPTHKLNFELGFSHLQLEIQDFDIGPGKICRGDCEGFRWSGNGIQPLCRRYGTGTTPPDS